MIRRLLREPLLHFLLLGALLFLAYGWLNRAGLAAPDEIVVSRGRVDGLVMQFERVWQRAPTAEERQALRDAVPRTALHTPIRKTTTLEIARQALAISKAGLKRRALLDAEGRDEQRFLEPVEIILREGCAPADELLSRYEGAWGGSTAPLFTEYSF